MEGDIFCCELCSKRYKHFNSLRRHIKTNHPENLQSAAPLPERKYKCSGCTKQFNTKHFLSAHERKVHNIEYVKTEPLYKCPLCGFKDFGRNKVLLHISNAHDLNIEHENLEFLSRDDFYKWKKNVEIDTNSKFVNTGGASAKRKTKFSFFSCHRSGYYKSKGKLIRSLKTQGSCKLNALCPARIICKEENGICKIKYTSTHAHKIELEHLQLTSMERSAIAAKITAKVPFDIILSEIRESKCENTDLKRLHCLTRKDLHNIKNSLNLCTTGKHDDNEAVSVNVWVKEENINSCVPLYKPQDTVKIIKQISGNKSTTKSFAKEKENVKSQFIELIDGISTPQQLHATKKHLASLKSTIDSLLLSTDLNLHENIA